jgi:hypothetical protein
VSGILGAAVISSLSKLTEKEEWTNIFAAQAFMGVVMSLVASPVFGTLYQLTELTVPGAIFVLCTGVCTIILIFVM